MNLSTTFKVETVFYFHFDRSPTRKHYLSLRIFCFRAYLQLFSLNQYGLHPTMFSGDHHNHLMKVHNSDLSTSGAFSDILTSIPFRIRPMFLKGLPKTQHTITCMTSISYNSRYMLWIYFRTFALSQKPQQVCHKVCHGCVKMCYDTLF